MVRDARYVDFQMAESALPRAVFAGVLDLINGLRGRPAEAASHDQRACRTIGPQR